MEQQGLEFSILAENLNLPLAANAQENSHVGESQKERVLWPI